MRDVRPKNIGSVLDDALAIRGDVDAPPAGV